MVVEEKVWTGNVDPSLSITCVCEREVETTQVDFWTEVQYATRQEAMLSVCAVHRGLTNYTHPWRQRETVSEQR